MKTSRKRRAPPKPRRFVDLEAGAILIHRPRYKIEKHHPTRAGTANCNSTTERVEAVGLAMVTDRWFDPVEGQHNRWSGEMAAILPITSSGPGHSKWRYTLRGLAQNGYHPATEDQQLLVSDWLADRVRVQMALDAKRITLAEARVQWPNWALLMKRLGLEPA